MSNIWLLAGTASALGFLHTIAGPDHYVPFAAIARARRWNLRRTLVVTFLCGLGHVLSSVLLGFLGVALGLTLGSLEEVEAHRGNIATWLLIGFGIAYLVWGIKKAYRGKPHAHPHVHANGQVHVHSHTHENEHAHVHEGAETGNVTTWVLFLIFVFGPCEPLIPLVIYPAAQHSLSGVFFVTLAFSVTTIATMLTTVTIISLGLGLLRLGNFERYSHVLAGAIVLTCGLLVQFAGL